MKSAIETIAKGQARLVRECSLSMGSEYSLTTDPCQDHASVDFVSLTLTKSTVDARRASQPAQGTSTESSVGESLATTYSAGSASERFRRTWVSRGGT